MDIYEYLKKDHKKVSDLFKKFEETEDTSFQAEIVEMIIEELTIHAESEEETFYKILENFEKSEKEAKHGEKEHTEMKEKIAEIASATRSSEAWHKKVLELKKLVEHHVKEEESDIFAKAKKVLSEKDAINIKELMHDYKEQMLQMEQ